MIDRVKLSEIYAREQRDFVARHPRSALAYDHADHLFEIGRASCRERVCYAV